MATTTLDPVTFTDGGKSKVIAPPPVLAKLELEGIGTESFPVTASDDRTCAVTVIDAEVTMTAKGTNKRKKQNR